MVLRDASASKKKLSKIRDMTTLNCGIGSTSSLPRLVQHPWSCARVHEVVTALEIRKSYTLQVVGIRVWYFSYFGFLVFSLCPFLWHCVRSCWFDAHLLPHNRRGSILWLSSMSPCVCITVPVLVFVLVFVFVFFFGLVFIPAFVF